MAKTPLRRSCRVSSQSCQRGSKSRDNSLESPSLNEPSGTGRSSRKRKRSRTLSSDSRSSKCPPTLELDPPSTIPPANNESLSCTDAQVSQSARLTRSKSSTPHSDSRSSKHSQTLESDPSTKLPAAFNETKYTDAQHRLIQAAKNGEWSKVTEYLNTNRSKDIHYHSPYSPILNPLLHESVLQDNLFMMQTLLVHGAMAHRDGTNCLHIACERGDIAVVKLIVKQGLSDHPCSYLDDGGNSALHLCQGRNGAVSITSLLLRDIRDPKSAIFLNKQNKKGETPAMKAVQGRNVGAIIHLIRSGADLSLKDDNGKTVFEMTDEEHIKSLVEFLSVDIYDEQSTPLMRAVMQQNVEMLRLLLMARYFCVDEVLHARAGPLAELQHCLLGDTALTVLFNSKWKNRKAPVTRSQGRKSLRMETYEDLQQDFLKPMRDKSLYDFDLSLVLEADPNLNQLNMRKLTFLPFTKIELSMIGLLLDYGASITTAGRYGDWNNPLNICCEMENLDLLTYMTGRHRADNLSVWDIKHIARALSIAVRHGNHQLLDQLSDYCGFINDHVVTCEQSSDIAEEHYEYLVYAAVLLGRTETASRMIERVVKFDLYNAILLSIQADHHHMCMLLCEKKSEDLKALISSEDRDYPVGRWLGVACKNENVKIVRHLLKSGLNKDTFLEGLVNCKTGELLKLLLDHGADLSEKMTIKDNGVDGPAETHSTTVGEGLVYISLKSKSQSRLTVLLNHGPQHGLKFSFPFFFGICYGRLFNEKLHVDENARALIAAHIPEMNLDLDTEDDGSRLTLIGAAITGRYWDLLESLLQNGADPNKSQTMRLAVQMTGDIPHEKVTDIVRLLVDHGADLTTNSHNISCVLGDLSVIEHNQHTFKYLLDAGVNVNAADFFDGLNVFSQILENLDKLYAFSELFVFIRLLLKHGKADISHPKSIWAFLFLMHADSMYEDLQTGAIDAGVDTSHDWQFVLDVCLDLMHSGLFAPTCVFDEHFDIRDYGRYNFQMLVYNVLNPFRRNGYFGIILTPFVMALVLGNLRLARHMYHIQFLTSSDYTSSVNKNPSLRLCDTFRDDIGEDVADNLQFLEDMSRAPPSLYRLVFALVSDLIGPGPGRRDKVRQLELPFPICDALLFQSPDQMEKKVSLLGRARTENAVARDLREARAGDAEDERPLLGV